MSPEKFKFMGLNLSHNFSSFIVSLALFYKILNIANKSLYKIHSYNCVCFCGEC